MITKLYEFLNQSTYLYHNLDIERLYEFIENDELLGYSSQRFWEDGLGRKDNDSDYETSYWYKGISTTRDLNFAKYWGKHAIIVFDRDKLKTKYKIVPYQWNYTIGADYVKDYKKEREEFVVTGIQKKWDYLKAVGSIQPLSKYMKGFYLVDEKNIYKNDIEFYKELKNKKYFLGTYNIGNRDIDYMKTQTKDITDIKKKLR